MKNNVHKQTNHSKKPLKKGQQDDINAISGLVCHLNNNSLPCHPARRCITTILFPMINNLK